MKLLIDECLPRALKRLLGDHECRTVQEMGWSAKKNGVLLSLAERSCSLRDPIRSKIWSPSSQQLLLLFAASILGARFGLGRK